MGIFFKNNYLFISFLHRCMFPGYCFHQRTYVVHCHVNGVRNETWTLSCLLTKEWPVYKHIQNWKSFDQQTRKSSSLIEYPIYMSLLHMFTDEKSQAGNLHVRKNEINK